MHVLKALTVLFVVLAAACGTDDGSLKPSAGSGAPVSIGMTTTAQFGAILVGTDGLSLYTRGGDSATSSTCTDSCATAWPPLIVPKGQQAVGGPGVNGTFGILARPDGTFQATYADHPLYYSQGDARPGDVTGDGLEGFSVATP